jgi:hypothetical protein
MIRAIFISFFLYVVMLGTANAVYNANMFGQLDSISVYADGDSIYFHVINQPTTHPGCNPAYFVIDETISSDRRKAMLSRLYLARATQENLYIGYDNLGNCADGYIRVHRVG